VKIVKVQKVLRELPQDCFHRADFRHCPHCEEPTPTEEWFKYVHIVVIGEVHGKHPSGALVSECPKCFKKSWVHRDLALLEYEGHLDANAKYAAKEELARRQLVALRLWGAGLCWNCTHLKSGSVSTATHRTCKRGFGPTQIECELYEAVK
jgi:hypothetical protein